MTTQHVAALALIRIVADAIRNLGEVPSGHLYARMMGHMSLATYTSIITNLKRAKLVKESAHLLTWIGPRSRTAYYVTVFKGGLVYDRQVHDAEGFSISTFIREMLSHGYGLDVRMEER